LGNRLSLQRVVGALLSVLACSATAGAASLVGTTTATDAFSSASRFFTHCANGHRWIAYHGGTVTGPVIYSSPDAVSWTPQGTVFSALNPSSAGQWAVRFSGNDLIAIGTLNAGPKRRWYRNFTLNSSGTVTPNAADLDVYANAGQLEMNALIAGGTKPFLWMADGTPSTVGDEARGNQLNNPTTPFPSVPGGVGPPTLSNATTGQFSAGAFHMTGGADPDDFIVLRATTLPTYTAGAHRLVATRFDASIPDYVSDLTWYNVSLDGCTACVPSIPNAITPEDADTEVKPGTDAEAHLRFAAVRDVTGNLHAVYVNRNDNVVHYKKDVGFNDSWSRISTDVTVATEVIDRVALTALANDKLLLYYSKSDNGIYMRVWNGATWGSEGTLKTASATPLQGALASMELAESCNAGVAWVEGSGPSYSVMFSSLPTAVTLAGFDARGRDGAVELSWETASELDNLGFHVYRAPSADGPWTRISSSLIRGLGSSPEGKRYSWLDSGLTNGVTYSYRLEDVDRSGVVTSHGPVSGTPESSLPPPTAPAESGLESAHSGGRANWGGSGETPPQTAPGANWMPHGNPSDVSLRVLKRSASSLTLELTTGGFYAHALEDGTSRLHVPGFFDLSDPGLPQIPTRRAWVEVPAGSNVRVASVVPTALVAFRGLRVARAGAPEAIVERGTYQASFRRVRPQVVRRGLFPDALARVLETAFQGETKKAYVELAPLRVDAASGQVVLARKLVVRLVFQGRARAERSRGGSRGRLEPGAGAQRAAPAARMLARFATRSSGLHAVAFEEVMNAGGARVLSSSWLRLSRLGEPVAFHVEPRADRFGPGSTLFFLAEDPQAAYGNETVYELAIASGGVQMPIGRSARNTTLPTAALPALVASRSFETNTNYLPALLEARDLWFWDFGLLAPSGRDYPFSVASLSPSSGQASLSLDLQGGSDCATVDPDHQVRVSLNGVPIGEAHWDGLRAFHLEASFDASILEDGPNALRLDNMDTTGRFDSVVYLDRFSVDYPHALVAEMGRLEGRAPSSGLVQATGFSPGSLLLDVSTATPRWLSPVLAGSQLVFTAEAQRRYLAVSPQALLRPEVRPAAAAVLRERSLQADWIVIAPEELLPTAAPLVLQREAQGLSARAVSLEQIRDEFGFGEVSPQAIRDFLAFAWHHWTAPSPRYVLLLGDATSDPKGFLPTASRKDLLPSPLTRSTFLWTASDPSLAAVNGDDSIPDLAIGRITAGSLSEAQIAVQKILDFENSSQNLAGRAVLVADNPDLAGDFEANANDIASLFQDRQVERIFLTQLGSTTRSAVVNAFDEGASLVSYVGHGSQGVWASEGILRASDVALLQPQPRQPFLLTMTCSNGYFISPRSNALSERLVLAGEKGAIAAFSPSGLSLDDAAHLFHRALVQQLETGGHERIGDLVLAAQKDYADTGAFPELLSLYHLFADPALRIR